VDGFPSIVLEEGESSDTGVLDGSRDGCYSKVVLSALGFAPTLGISFGGNDKKLWIF
jgi:hypothetical protein